ncbi:pyridoxal phosphate-dependent transferase [Aspergillus falconensis]
MPPLQTTDIQALGENAASLPLGDEPVISSDNFKSLYIESQQFQGSELKKTSSPVALRKIISLGTGRATAEYYHWEWMTFRVHDTSPVPENAARATSRPLICTIPKRDNTYNLSIGLHYGRAAGSLHLLRGDTILRDRYTYPAYGVDMDKNENLSGLLEEVVSSWDSQRRNPRAIYGTAEKHDLSIIENGPYHFPRMRPYTAGTQTDLSSVTFATESAPSYLFLDISGCVICPGSASKILAPGLRVCCVTASSQIIGEFLAYQDVSTVVVNGLPQLMLWSLLGITWRHHGFTKWLVYLSRGRHPAFNDICGNYSLDTESLEWDLEACIEAKALEAGVLVSRGSLFPWNKKANAELNFRMAFAAAGEEDLEEGVRLFTGALKEEFPLPLDKRQ